MVALGAEEVPALENRQVLHLPRAAVLQEKPSVFLPEAKANPVPLPHHAEVESQR